MHETNVQIVDYSPLPGGRSQNDGPFSGERFRREFLVPALKKAIDTDGILNVVLDEVLGYSSSFLEEVFGGLVRAKVFPKDKIKKHLRIIARNRIYESARLDAQKYLDEALRRE